MHRIRVDELIPGDLILCHGKGFISNSIMLLENANYSHAALYVGNGEIMHAYPPELCRTSIDFLFQEEEFMDAYRLVKDGKDFNSFGFDANEVIQIGENYISRKEEFAMSHLYLIALNQITRDIPLPQEEKVDLREKVDQITKKLFHKLDKGKQPMLCSEFVYRCFCQADSTGKYLPELDYGKNRKNKIKEALSKLDEIDDFDELQHLLYTIELEDKRNGEELKLVIPSCVSPKDLFLSPNFIPLGRISK